MFDSDDLIQHLPYLRRYARALTGSQARGDAYVRATLETLTQSPTIASGMSTRVALFRVFHLMWSGTHKSSGPAIGKNTGNRTHLAGLIGNLSLTRREALLLSTMERFSPAEIGAILDLEENDVERHVDEGVNDLVAPIPASVLIIEDEPLISMDLCQIVEDMGHAVAGIATTYRQALAACAQAAPDLVLADIQLADGSCGIAAVDAILEESTIPVVFITAHAERLLTGEQPEPVFLVTKPFATRTVKAAIGQALLLAEDHGRGRHAASSETATPSLLN